MALIEKVSQIPFPGFDALKQASVQEGFRFLERLEQEWLRGENRFSGVGEVLYKLVEEDQLVGMGGINRCPYHPQKNVGRLRRFYIAAPWRRQGMGRHLVQHILDRAQMEFGEIVLYTDKQQAASFYKSLNFVPIHNRPKVSHQWRVERTHV